MTEHASGQVLLQWPSLGWDGIERDFVEKNDKGLIDRYFFFSCYQVYS